MIKDWSKKHTFILVGLIVAGFIVYGISYVVIINPLKAELNAVEKQEDMYDKQLNKLEEQLNRNLEQDDKNITVQLPKQKAPDNTLRHIQKLATSSNVMILSLQFVGLEGQSEKDLPVGVNSDNYSLEATANNLDEMNTFLIAMQNSENLLTIDTINLDKNKNDINLTVTYTTYYTAD
ncbi:hypothetical protein [Virgibacillus ndiopensis]|uniref:hypothetical protein n=1 Tax=Virgibacillus ndiopensis TaxID=2004408 RepID=UPI000C06D233|nr:hypothetical protein [Virgibacillus ndiopensis]